MALLTDYDPLLDQLYSGTVTARVVPGLDVAAGMYRAGYGPGPVYVRHGPVSVQI